MLNNFFALYFSSSVLESYQIWFYLEEVWCYSGWRQWTRNWYKSTQCPFRLFLDNNQFLYIVEWSNHSVTKWNLGNTVDHIAADGNGQGSRNDQLNYPVGIVVDRGRDSLFIGDAGNKRLVRWSLQGARSGKTIISGVGSTGLTMDEQGFLYVSDWNRQEVRRWGFGDSQGTLRVRANDGEGERGIDVPLKFFRFLVIVMIRSNTYSIQFLLAPSTIA